MHIYEIILVLVFLAAFGLVIVLRRRYPEKVNKLIPYNYLVLGSLFCYLNKGNDNNTFIFSSGVAFFAYGVFLLVKRDKERKL